MDNIENDEVYIEGYDRGYEQGQRDADSYHDEIVDKVSESSYERGYSEAERKFTSEMETLRYEFESNIKVMMERVKELSKQLYIQRKDYETITRSLRKGTN